ncbi:hypothetical protein [Brevundimonas variabilis]|uniref:Uncharacterized protein n=1 Tax=Brevundimonas variabilis TaxID=74312 RepID=A0A7W9FE82_9CAUL|nr:hypothetical protein [Brevundimonas variabilis]MBB5746037.1 hypothetical protein [Brevundimonas variabilis]
MKPILLALGLTALVVVGCDDPGNDQSDASPMMVEAAPAAEDVAADVVETEPEVVVPVDPVPVLPPDDATSQESVTPESETLFY